MVPHVYNSPFTTDKLRDTLCVSSGAVGPMAVVYGQNM